MVYEFILKVLLDLDMSFSNKTSVESILVYIISGETRDFVSGKPLFKFVEESCLFDSFLFLDVDWKDEGND